MGETNDKWRNVSQSVHHSINVHSKNTTKENDSALKNNNKNNNKKTLTLEYIAAPSTFHVRSSSSGSGKSAPTGDRRCKQ